jgi:hypothetical protein
MKSFHLSLVIVVLATLVATGTDSLEQSVASSVVMLASPAAAGSAQPQLTVSAHGVLLSWIERAGDLATLKFSERTGQGWTPPRTAASGRDWFVNWADVPSVLRLADGSLYAHWLQKSAAAQYAYDVRLARSTDEGKTWAASFTPHNDRTPTEHGFASLFQMPGGGLGLVWLDGRAMKSGHGEHGSGDMSVRAAVYDTKGTQIAEGPIDLRACECCPTAAAVTADGPIVAYRDRSAAEIRDIYVSRHVSGKWTEPVPVHRDNWQIAACPVNGPALSAKGRDVALAWFRATGDDGHSYVAFSQDSGKSFGKPVRLDDASALGRVDVALLEDGSAAATWIEFADGKAQFLMRRVSQSGERSPAVSIAGLTANRTSGFPRMAAFGSELVFAWTDSTAPSSVKTAALTVTKVPPTAVVQ